MACGVPLWCSSGRVREDVETKEASVGAAEHKQPSGLSGEAPSEEPAWGGEQTESPVLDETLPADRAGWEAWADAGGVSSTDDDGEGQPGR